MSPCKNVMQCAPRHRYSTNYQQRVANRFVIHIGYQRVAHKADNEWPQRQPDDVQNKQIAFTKDFIKKQGVYNFEVGDKKLVMVYFPEYETIACFNREKDGQTLDITNISIDGTTEYGTLKQEYIYNSVLWAVWAYYYPKSEVIKSL